jgi:hypothetical protein
LYFITARRLLGGFLNWTVIAFSFPAAAGSTARVAAWRRLKRLGAISPRHGLYVLPGRDSCNEAATWLSQEVEQAGGEALVMNVESFTGLDDDQLFLLFHAAIAERYQPLEGRLAEVARRLAADERDAGLTADLAAEIGRVQAEFDEVAQTDYFDSPGGRVLAATLQRLREDVSMLSREPVPVPRQQLETYRGRVWVTRARPHIDRTACAWLIRRFIDPQAEIRYRSQPQDGEVPFDMAAGEFRHLGNRCTFEVMLDAFGLEERGLQPIAEIVHEIDLRDSRYARPEVPGVEAVLSGWHSSGLSDEEIERAAQALFDGLYGRFRRHD